MKKAASSSKLPKASGDEATKESPKKAGKPTSNHPSVAIMAMNAVKTLNERNGSSLTAIKKFMSTNYECDSEKLAPFLKKFIKSAVDKNDLIQTSGKGATGSFKINKAAEKAAEKAAKMKKSSSKSKLVMENQPSKSPKKSPKKPQTSAQDSPPKKATKPTKSKEPEAVTEKASKKPKAKPQAPASKKTIQESNSEDSEVEDEEEEEEEVKKPAKKAASKEAKKSPMKKTKTSKANLKEDMNDAAPAKKNKKAMTKGTSSSKL